MAQRAGGLREPGWRCASQAGAARVAPDQGPGPTAAGAHGSDQHSFGSVITADPTAADSTAVGVRDTKDRGTGPVLAVDPGRWAEFVAEVAGARPHTNGALAVTERAETRHYPARGAVPTRWHLRCLADGTELHFDDREWEAFRLGAADGEFDRASAQQRSATVHT